ncbi:MAG TPA: guanine deaminase [Lactobacillus sp.]|nr:guanine deaminase [Lactobacillus sp.]
MSFSRVIVGNFYSSHSYDRVSYNADSAVCIDHTGMIQQILSKTDPNFSKIIQTAKTEDRLTFLNTNEVLLPGFIDLHIHAPQWPQTGTGLDLPLKEWLNDYTFPLEAKYANHTFAKKVYSDLVSSLLAHGTTTAVYFGTMHVSANIELARQCLNFGQRAFIGQVAMDNPFETPDYYRDSSTSSSLSATMTFIQKLTELTGPSSRLVKPIITPRFVPSCTDDLLEGLGKLAHRFDLPIQTHCSESIWEHNYAISRFHKHDTAVLDHFGLLTDKAILAHGTQLDETDLQQISNAHAAIAHCPISNIYFGDGIFTAARAHRYQIDVGLGTDIAGGFSPSLYRNIQQSIMSSRQLPNQSENHLTTANAFYLATYGGAKSLGLKTGLIKPGYWADFQIVCLPDHNDRPASDNNQLERLLYATTANDIKSVYVAGQQVI